MEPYQSYKGKDFILHIFDEDGVSMIGLSSSYVYPQVSKDELKALADFIYNYLENKE